MTGHDGTKGNTQSRNPKVRRRRVVIMGGAIGAFLAAAAMATGSAVTAAPAKADFEDLLDPIIQPLLTSLTDSLAGFDPAAATDLTSWTDSLLSSLNSIDLALPSTAEPAASAASSAFAGFDPAAATDLTSWTDSLLSSLHSTDLALPSTAEPAASAASSASDPTTGTYDIPITVQEDTEPTVQATVDGSNTTLLADTGSSGLVIPWQDLGTSHLEVLRELHESGAHLEKIGLSGYSGGVDYTYREYDGLTVDYGNGALTTTNTPVDVEMFSWPTSFSAPHNFVDFLKDDDVTGILGIGPTGTEPATSPLEAAGFTGVTVDIPQNELIVGDTNPGTAIATVSGAPISSLYESVNGGAPVHVSADIDSGGVYGTIPSSLVGSSGSLPSGTEISVYDSSGTPLYSYATGTDSLGDSTAPTVVSGNSIDSGIEPFLKEPIYIDYSDKMMSFDYPLSS